MDTNEKSRVPENAPGDFYVERDMCLRCCNPHAVAPDLLNDPDEEFENCYFRRQPRTAAEVEQAVEALRVSCCGAMRYGGRDGSIISRLRGLGLTEQCDWGEGIAGGFDPR